MLDKTSLRKVLLEKMKNIPLLSRHMKSRRNAPEIIPRKIFSKG